MPDISPTHSDDRFDHPFSDATEAEWHELVTERRELTSRVLRVKRELHYRVVNNLQVMEALLYMIAGNNSTSVPISMVMSVRRQLMVMRMAHDWSDEEIGLNGVPAQSLFDHILPTLNSTLKCETTWAASDVRLSCRQATALCLVINEVLSAIRSGSASIVLGESDSGVMMDLRSTAHFPDRRIPSSISDNDQDDLIGHLVRADLNGDYQLDSTRGFGSRLTVTFPRFNEFTGR